MPLIHVERRVCFPPIADIRFVIQNLRMKSAALAALVVSLLACATPIVAQSNPQSSPQDRQRFISITQKLQEAPLDPTLRADRQWALQWLVEAPDVSVNACLAPLGGPSLTKYSHSDEIIAQYTFAMAALIIQHPEAVNDPQAQQLAGAEGALIAYRAMLRADPKAKSAELDKLLEMQGRGELPGFVRGSLSGCYTGKGEEVRLR